MSPHLLRRFLRYTSKVYGLRELVRGYTDRQRSPQIAPGQIFLSVFWLWVFRWHSLQQLERRMTEEPWRQAQLLAGRRGSVDTIA